MEKHELDSQEFIKDLLSPERQEAVDPFMVMTFMPIEAYDHVADIGCGPGYFSIPMAKHLVYGKLYALDVSDEMLDALRERVAEANLGNVDVMKCGPTDFPVPEGSLDGVFLAFVTHYNEDRVAFLKAAAELLRPRGWCTVLEFYRKETEHGPPLHERIEPAELRQMAQEAGLEFRSLRDFNGDQYMAVFRKVR